jgi:hypothetical protein
MKILKELTGCDSAFEKFLIAYRRAVRDGDLEEIAGMEAMIKQLIEQYRVTLEAKEKLAMESIRLKAVVSFESGCFNDRRAAQLLAEAKAAMADGVLGSVDRLRIDPFSL